MEDKNFQNSPLSLHECPNLEYFPVHQLVELSKELNCFSLDEIVAVILTRLPDLFAVSYVAVFFYNLEQNEIALWQHNQGPLATEKVSCTEEDNILVHAAFQESPIVFANVAEYEKQIQRKFQEHPCQKYFQNFCLLIPLSIGKGRKRERIGLLALANRRENHPFREIEKSMATLVGEILAHSICRLQLLMPLKTTTIVDVLTGSFRWHPFYEYLSREIYRVNRYDCSLSLILLDIDHFQDINNTAGKEIGDRVLSETAALIHRKLRSVDIVSRQDDCFLILLPETEVKDAMIVAERLRKSLTENHFEFGNHSFFVTVSIGVVGYRESDSPVHFLKKAEIALSRAMQNGGNQIVVYNIVADE